MIGIGSEPVKKGERSWGLVPRSVPRLALCWRWNDDGDWLSSRRIGRLMFGKKLAQ